MRIKNTLPNENCRAINLDILGMNIKKSYKYVQSMIHTSAKHNKYLYWKISNGHCSPKRKDNVM